MLEMADDSVGHRPSLVLVAPSLNFVSMGNLWRRPRGVVSQMYEDSGNETFESLQGMIAREGAGLDSLQLAPAKLAVKIEGFSDDLRSVFGS